MEQESFSKAPKTIGKALCTADTKGADFVLVEKGYEKMPRGQSCVCFCVCMYVSPARSGRAAGFAAVGLPAATLLHSTPPS